MTQNLSPQDLACLNECRAVAIENSRFYARAYDAATDSHDRTLIGSAAAQRKVFVEAMSAILAGAHETPAKPSHNRLKGLIIKLPDALSFWSSKEFRSMASKHEEQFNNALNHGIDYISDDTTREVLKHHIMAAKIATQALIEADIVDKE